MTLLLSAKHNDKRVDLAGLGKMSDPASLGPHHRPYRYDEIVNELQAGASRAGFEVVNTELALSRGGKMLLGILQLVRDKSTYIGGLRSNMALGFRASTHSLSALKCVAGSHVFLCSNLIISGEMFIVQRKFTTNLRLPVAVDRGYDMFLNQHKQMTDKVGVLERYTLADPEAKAMTFDAVTKFNMPLNMVRDVDKWYFGTKNDEGIVEDCAPRTKWGLHNAFTRSLREFPPQTRFEHTQAVGRMFGI